MNLVHSTAINLWILCSLLLFCVCPHGALSFFLFTSRTFSLPPLQGHWSHPQQKEIYEKLDSLLVQIKKAGYVPCTDSVAVDMDDGENEKLLHRHCERIAIAFALLSMPYGKPIIVKKNLRVCVDCHSAIKYISKVVG